uniref:OTU domain-containing protein n=1 Tax=viral metagenome TaxID=1070528 RepID=A0A6C0DGC0_9ZZZZ
MNIPNELKITINTSIPGFQVIKYKPFMTLPNDNTDGFVHFNPLIKLKQSVINSIPKNFQVKEFFNKGLFQSLINSHGLIETKNLVDATNEGIVDNNIKVTLDTLFPTNGIIYINKEAYVIADVQWTKGDWKIDKKIQELPNIRFNRITDPFLLSSLAKQKQLSGEEEMKKLPEDVLFGPNYSPPEPTPSAPQAPLPSAPQAPLPLPSAPQTQLLSTQPSQNLSNNQRIKLLQQSVSPSAPIEGSQNKFPQKYLPIMPPPPQPSAPIIEEKEEDEDETENSTYETKLINSVASNKTVKDFFQNKSYYFMVNFMFKNMNKTSQNLINKLLVDSTNVNIKSLTNLSKVAYDKSVVNTQIYSNKGKGDCFFLAIADGINYNNRYSNDKIIYNNYGKGNMIFTQSILREIVTKYILEMNDQTLTDLLQIGETNAELLNNEFNSIKNNLQENWGVQTNNFNDQQFMYLLEAIDNIYKTNDSSFLILKPIIKTIADLNKPFHAIKNKSEIKSYIESSNYWANTLAIDAIIYTLGLNIITVKYDSNQNKMSIPYINTSVSNWNKYLFLYYQNYHYELMTFDYVFNTIQKRPKLEIKTTKKKIIFFDRNTKNIYPPLWLIFLIFGSYYINILYENEKNKFTIFPYIFDGLINTFNKILTLQESEEKKLFLKTFKNYFNPSILREKQQRGAYITSQLPDSSYQSYQHYNQYDPYNPYRRYNQNVNAISGSKIVDNDSYNTNISYYITIDMELKKGKQLSIKDMVDIKCRQKWNTVRRNYANLRGIKYVIPPVYDNAPSRMTIKNIVANKNYTKKNQKKKRKKSKIIDKIETHFSQI